MSEKNGKELFYRLRSIEKILKFEELKKQEIYFASLDELNDPMENSRNLVFSGEKEKWEGLFILYVLFLEWAYIKLDETGGEYDVLNNLDNMRKWVERGTTTKFSCQVYKDFIEECDVVIDKIATRTTPVGKDELLFYLEHLFLIILKIMHKHYNPCCFDSLPYQFNTIIEKITKKIDEIEEFVKNKNDEQDYQECLGRILDKNDPKTRPMYLNFNPLENMLMSADNAFALPHCPYFYLLNLEYILYLESYVACFMKEAHDSSVWAHYADGHKGVCLIFETKNQSLTLNQNNKSIEAYLGKVEYDNPYQTINVLELMKEKISKEEREKLHNGLFIKMKDWKKEQEYRIILSKNPEDKTNKENRKVTYNFKDLDGIVFGIRTSLQDKIDIINIIKEKCIKEKRENFNFYQAYYCQASNQIEHLPLNISLL